MDTPVYGKAHTALLNFYNETKAVVASYLAQNKAIITPYQLVKVKSIDYESEGYQFDWGNLEYFDYHEWPTRSYVQLTDHLKTLKVLDVAAAAIIDDFSPPKAAADFVQPMLMSWYVSKLLKKIPNNKVSDATIGDFIEKFLGDYQHELAGKKTTWNITAWISNIKLESEEVELAHGVTLRRPLVRELDYVEQRDTYHNELDRLGTRVLPALAVLCFSVESKTEASGFPSSALYEIEKWLNILRLFKPGTFRSIFQSAVPESVFKDEFSQNNEPLAERTWRGKIEQFHTSDPKFNLKKTEEGDLKVFAKKMRPIIKTISHKNYLDGNYYDLAMHRYIDALVKSEVNAYRIQSTMTVLEALLSNDGTEITYKMRLRVAGILRNFGVDTIHVFDLIKDAYTLRSKLVHGSKTKDNNKDFLEFARMHTPKFLITPVFVY